MRRVLCGLAFWLVPALGLALEPATVLPPPAELEPGEVPWSAPLAPLAGGAPWLVEIQGAFGVADAFFAKGVLTLRGTRFWGAWGVDLWGGRAFSWEAPALLLCPSGGRCHAPSSQALAATPGRLDWLAGAALVFRLAEGKHTLSGLVGGGFSLDLRLGAAAVGYELRDGGEAQRWSPAARLGIDLSGAISRQARLGLGLHSLLYVPEIRGARSLEQQLLLGLNLGWGWGGGR